MTTSEPVMVQESRIAIRELDHRASEGIEVRLLWDAETKDVLVSVVERDGWRFEFQVDPTNALDAFHHPYAYAAYGEQYILLAA